MTSNRCIPVENTSARNGVDLVRVSEFLSCQIEFYVVLCLVIDVHKFVSQAVINRKRNDQCKLSDSCICDGIYVLSLQASPKIWDHHVLSKCHSVTPE